MTLTELSVFMKKQELELQLRTGKEREEGEYRLIIDHRTRSGRYVTQYGCLLKNNPPNANYAVHETVAARQNKPPEIKLLFLF